MPQRSDKLMWKRGDGWVQYNPNPHHPCYEEWMKQKEKEIDVLKNHAQANVHLHMMNIEAYFKNPAGIGEHSDIMEAIQGEMDKMAVHEDRLAILNNWPEGDE